MLSRVLGRPVTYRQVPWDQFRKQMGDETYGMYRWFEDVGYSADITALRKEYPGLAKLEQALRSEEWVTAARKKTP